MRKQRTRASSQQRPAPGRPTPAAALSRPTVGVLLAIFGVALVLRLVHLWQLGGSPFGELLLGDSAGYDRWARRIAGGDWIGTDVFYQAPLYPYVLGVLYTFTGGGPAAARLVQAVLGAASCVLLALAGGRFFSWRVGLVAGGLLAVYAPAIFMDGTIQKSGLDLFLLCVVLWLVGRAMPGTTETELTPAPTLAVWVGIGAALGGLSLTRENALVFVVAVLGWLFLERVAFGDGWWRRGLAIAGGMAIILLPVLARNAAVGGGFYLTTSQLGPNFYIGNNAGADGTYQPLRFGRGDPLFERDDATQLAQAATGRPMTPGEVSRYWTGEAISDITAAPGRWVALMGRKLALTWNAVEMIDTESQYAQEAWSVPLRLGGTVGHFGVMVPLAVFGLWVSVGSWRKHRLLVLMAGLYAASVIGFYVFARYRYPLVPFVLLYAAVGLAGGLAFLRAASGRTRFVCVTMLTAAVVFTNWPIMSKTQMRAVFHSNLGTAYRETGALNAAVAQYETALTLMPDYPQAHSNLGSLLAAGGEIDRAVSHYRRAIALDPGVGDVHFNYGNALLAQERFDEAADEYRAAIAEWPEDGEAHNNLGMALGSAGRMAEAAEAFREAARLDPDAPLGHANLAVALEALGQLEEAGRQRAEAERLQRR